MKLVGRNCPKRMTAKKKNTGMRFVFNCKTHLDDGKRQNLLLDVIKNTRELNPT